MIGVDVGGTKILAGLIARDGSVVSHREYPTPIENEDALLDGLEAAVREFLDQSVLAVGFGIPSQIDQRHGIALGSVWLGLVLSAMFNLPPSFFIVSTSFVVWLAAVVWDRRRRADVRTLEPPIDRHHPAHASVVA